MKKVSEAIVGKPVFYNDFDGTFGVIEHINGKPYILIPQWSPEQFNPDDQRKAELYYLFLGYAGEELAATDALKVIGLQFQNCVEDYRIGMMRMLERLESFFVIHDEIFDLVLKIEYTGKTTVNITVMHYIYMVPVTIAKLNNVELTDDCGIDDWVKLISVPVKALFPSADIKKQIKK